MSRHAEACALSDPAKTPKFEPPPNPGTAALLAWLVPGLGHLYQGRQAKGVLFMTTIVGLFVAGMIVGKGQVVYASTLPLTPVRSFVYDGWPFLCQSGIGAVAIPGWMERAHYRADAEESLFGGAMGVLYPPRTGRKAVQGPPITSEDQSGRTVYHPDGAAKRRYDLGFRFEVGMVYTVIAGLLNILVVYDAYSGPLLPDDDPKKKMKKSAESGSEKQDDPSPSDSEASA